MNLSHHAMIRSRQRSISSTTIEAIINHGKSFRRADGATELLITRRECRNLIQQKREEIHSLERTRDVAVLVDDCDSGKIITVYHRR